MTVLRLYVALCAGAFIIGGVCGQRRLSKAGPVVITIGRELTDMPYDSCALNNSRTNASIICAQKHVFHVYDCSKACYNHVMKLYDNNMLGPEMFDMWNLVGNTYLKTVLQTGFEIAYRDDARSSSGSQRIRRVEYIPGKLENMDYNSCRLQNQAGTTIHCGSHFRSSYDGVDCNDACAYFVYNVTDIDKIKGSWTLISYYRGDNVYQTGFNIIVEGNSETSDIDYTDTTTEEAIEITTSVTTDAEYSETPSTIAEGTTTLSGGVYGQGSLAITIVQKLPQHHYTSCKLINFRTGASVNCLDSYYSYDCNYECNNHVLNLYDNNMLGPDMIDMWNLVGKSYYGEEVQTGFEIGFKNDDRSSSGPQRTRRVEYKPNKLQNMGYNSCRLQNQLGNTIYCKSIFSWTDVDEVDCNDACASFVHDVTDIDKIKGSWTLIGKFYDGEAMQTGFDIIVEDNSETGTTTEEPIAISTSVTTDAEYTETTTAIGEGTTILSDDGWHVIVSDSSFVISIPHRLVDIHGSCQLNNSVTGEIITCKSYWYDCNDICSHYALNLAKRNKLDTGIWNLIGTSYNSGAVFYTAFEIASVDTVYKRRSVKYNPEKLMSEHFICKLQNQAGTTIYCRTVCQDYECDKVDCNDVCTTFVDRVRDVEKIKGNWTLIGETHDDSSQTGFEIVVEDNSETDTTTEEPIEISTSVTTDAEYTETTTAIGEGTTILLGGVYGQGSLAITIAQKLPQHHYTSCKLINFRTGESVKCLDSYYSYDCNYECNNHVLNLHDNNMLGPDMNDMWNLVGKSYYGEEVQTGFEIGFKNDDRSSSGPQRTRRVEYKPNKLQNMGYNSCRLQNQAGNTIYCKSIFSWTDIDRMDCNDACASFVHDVTDIDKIKGSWTLIGQFYDGEAMQTGFNIIVEDNSETGTTTEEPIAISTSVTTDAEYTETTTAIGEGTTILSDDGWHVIVSDSSFVISIPHRLVDIHGSCQLNNSVTGEIITCKSYWYDCNDICSHYALNLAKRNKLDTGIWNLIGTSYNSGAVFYTAFEIASVDTVYKRRSVKYNPEKLMSEHFICKLQNQAGTTIYCRTVCQDYECDKVDCNDVCTTFVDRVRDVEKIKGIWTLIGETHDDSSQTGFEIVVEDNSETDTTTEEPIEISTSVTTDAEYTETTTAIGEGTTILLGGVYGQGSLAITIAQKLPQHHYTSCKLINFRTGESVKCLDSYYSYDCNYECNNHVLNLHDNNMLGPDMNDMWNLVGKSYYGEEVQTGFEIGFKNDDRSSSGPQRTRRVEYKPNKLQNMGYNSCRLQNQAGNTIYCKSIFSWTDIDRMDCNDACASFVHDVTDIDKIKGSWTLIGQFYDGEAMQTGFNIIVEDNSETGTTTEEPIAISTSVTTDAEYTETTTAIGEGTTILSDDGWHVIVSDSSFVISIPHRLADIHGSCQLNNPVTGEIITCKSYWYDCNDICSHYALNLAKRNKLDTGIWNLIGTSYNSGAVFYTAFEIVSVDTVYKRRSVKYNPEKLMSEHFICKLQNQAGTTIYCRTVCQDYECDKVDCNDVCTTFVDRVRDVEKIKGIWTLIGETHDDSSQTGFEIVVEDNSETDTTTEEPIEISTSVTTDAEYTETTTAIGEGTTILSGGVYGQGSLVITIAQKLPQHLYASCKLINFRTGASVNCLDSYYSYDCNYECNNHVLNLYDNNMLGPDMIDMWNLVGKIYYEEEVQTGFEIGFKNDDRSSSGPQRTRRVEYKPNKMQNMGYNSCRLQNQAGNTIYCKSIFSWTDIDVVDCNDACASFVHDVTDIDKIKGSWTLIGQFYDGEAMKTGFDIIVEDNSETDTTTEEPIKISTSVTTDAEYTETTTAIGEGTTILSGGVFGQGSLAITIAQKLPQDRYASCILINLRTGASVQCLDSYYSYDCNYECINHVSNLYDNNMLGPDMIDMWNLVGKSYYGEEVQTSFKIAFKGTPGTDYTDTITEEATEVSTSVTTEIEYTDTTITVTEATTLTDDGLQVTTSDRRFIINLPHKLPGTYRSCRIQHSQTGEWLNCEYNGFIYSMDCNTICSRYVLDSARSNDIMDLGIWNLIGKIDYSEYKTAFEIAKVRSAHKRRSVTCRSKKLKSKYNYCKLQNQAGTTIHCKSIDPWGSNDRLDCFDACTAFIDRVIDTNPIIGNWTLIGDFYYSKGGRTSFEIIEEEAIDDPGTYDFNYMDYTTEETTTEGTAETENTDITTTTEKATYFVDDTHFNISDSSFVVNIPDKLPQDWYRSCTLNNSETGESLPCECGYTLFDCNFCCSRFALDLVKKESWNVGVWNIIAKARYYNPYQTALEITRVGVPHKPRSVKFIPKKLKRKYKTCRLQNQDGTTIYCKTFNGTQYSSEELNCNDACAAFVDHVIDIERIKGNWTLIGETEDVRGGRTGFEILVEATDDSRTTTTDYTDTTTEEAGEVSSSVTAGIEYTDTKPALVGATVSTGPISRSSDIQADRVVVEMPESLAVDQDLHFALSLVPMMRRRTLQDKLDVEIDILSYFKSKLANRTP